MAGAAGALASAGGHDVPPFPFEETTIAELQAQMAAGRLSSRRLTRAYLRRIRQIDLAGIRLNSVIELNPDALAIATDLDAERRRGKVRGPLHGIPVLVKDTIRRLRRAGAASASARTCWTTTPAAPAPGRARPPRPAWPRALWGPRPTGRSSARRPTTPWSGSSRPWG